MERLILGIDAGSHTAKIIGPFGTDSFLSNVCDWFERDVKERFSADDMEFEIDGQKGYAGTIAKYEDEFGGATIYGESKAHRDTKVRVLLAIHRYLTKHCPTVSSVAIVVGQPIKGHKETEKTLIKEMLLGKHQVRVNGVTRTFFIEKVGVAVEGSSAFWCLPQEGVIRIIDIGSGTINAATIIDKKHVNTFSDTFNFGMETINNKKDLEAVARGIIQNTTKLKWNKEDKIYICGGASEGIFPFIVEHYSNTELLNPQIRNESGVKILSPVFSNAVGFHEIAKGAFG